MAPPFNFLRNLTNHQAKTASPNSLVEPKASDQGDKSPKKLTRKSKKITHGHIIPPGSTRSMDAFGGILGEGVDDIGPSRYPAHPFQSALGTAGSHYLSADTTFRIPANNIDEGSQRSDISRLRSKGLPSMRSRSQYDAHRDYELNDFHTSTPHPPEPAQRRHAANAANSFVTPDETPVVSQYVANGPASQHAQMSPEVQPPPSRSWSPIPTVHRESASGDDDDDSYIGYQHQGVGDQVGNQSWITDGNLGNRFSASITDPRISTMADLGQPDSMSIHTIHYVEYPEERAAHETIPRSIPEHWETPPNITQNENIARRQPSQTYLQPPLPQPPPPPLSWHAQPMGGETVQAAMREHQYWGEEDSEPEIYHYIVPAGVKVIFQDQEGRIIARIAKDGTAQDLSQSPKSAPIIVHDEFGRELYRSKNIRGPSPTPRELRQGHFRTHVRSIYEEHNTNFRGDEVVETPDVGYRRRPPWLSQPSSISTKSTKTIMIDEKGNQFALKSPSLHREGGKRLENHDISYQAQVSYA